MKSLRKKNDKLEKHPLYRALETKPLCHTYVTLGSERVKIRDNIMSSCMLGTSMSILFESYFSNSANIL